MNKQKKNGNELNRRNSIDFAIDLAWNYKKKSYVIITISQPAVVNIFHSSNYLPPCISLGSCHINAIFGMNIWPRLGEGTARRPFTIKHCLANGRSPRLGLNHTRSIFYSTFFTILTWRHKNLLCKTNGMTLTRCNPNPTKRNDEIFMTDEIFLTNHLVVAAAACVCGVSLPSRHHTSHCIGHGDVFKMRLHATKKHHIPLHRVWSARFYHLL